MNNYITTEVKTEFVNMEEHDNAVRKAIERKAHASYECEGFKDGNDQEHWFRAERELTIQDITASNGNGIVSIRLPIDKFPPSALVISVSSRSLLIFRLRDDASNDCEDSNRDLLRVILLPAEADSAQLTSEIDDGDLALRLPLAPHAPADSKSNIFSKVDAN